jgi:hypothetical protein
VGDKVSFPRPLLGSALRGAVKAAGSGLIYLDDIGFRHPLSST